MSHVALALALGLTGGLLAGIFGVGGGIVFVPALTLGLGLGQLTAEATSLAAIIPVVAVGSFRQNRDGLVHWPSAAILANAEVADLFDLLGDLYELDGAVVYRVLAYRRAAKRFRETAESVWTLSEQGR